MLGEGRGLETQGCLAAMHSLLCLGILTAICPAVDSFTANCQQEGWRGEEFVKAVTCLGRHSGLGDRDLTWTGQGAVVGDRARTSQVNRVESAILGFLFSIEDNGAGQCAGARRGGVQDRAGVESKGGTSGLLTAPATSIPSPRSSALLATLSRGTVAYRQLPLGG